MLDVSDIVHDFSSLFFKIDDESTTLGCIPIFSPLALSALSAFFSCFTSFGPAAGPRSERRKTVAAVSSFSPSLPPSLSLLLSLSLSFSPPFSRRPKTYGYP